MAIKVLSFGEVLWDIIEGNYCIGGAPLNFAGHMAKLGARPYMVSAVGHDPLGDKAVAFVESQNIDTSFISRNDSPTGTVLVELKAGIPSYDIVQGAAWDGITLNGDKGEKLKSEEWDVLYLGSLAQRTETSRKTLSWILENVESREVFFDVNLRQNWYSREVIEESIRHTTILKVNDEEVSVVAELLFSGEMSGEELARAVIEKHGVSVVIITLGGDGALFFDRQREYKLRPEPADVVDTVGAGDSFSGAFVYSYLNTGDIDRAGKLALDVASFVVSSEGALPEYSEELKKKIQLHLK